MLFRTCLILIHSKRLRLMRGKGLMHVFKQFGSLTQHSCRHLKSSAKYSSASQLLKLMLIHLSYISISCLMCFVRVCLLKNNQLYCSVLLICLVLFLVLFGIH